MANESISSKSENLSTVRRGPPVSPILLRLINPLLKALLRSPFHSRVSGQLMLLTFTGRKTGKKFSTPVGYLRKGNQVLVFTHSAWWKNFIGSAPVSLRIQGRELQGIAQPVSDPQAVHSMVLDLIAANGEERSRQMGFWVQPGATTAEVAQAVQGTFFVPIELTGEAR